MAVPTHYSRLLRSRAKSFGIALRWVHKLKSISQTFAEAIVMGSRCRCTSDCKVIFLVFFVYAWCIERGRQALLLNWLDNWHQMIRDYFIRTYALRPYHSSRWLAGINIFSYKGKIEIIQIILPSTSLSHSQHRHPCSARTTSIELVHFEHYHLTSSCHPFTE